MNENGSTGPGAGWDFWRDGLDPAFFRRVYSRSTFMGGALSLLCLGLDQRPLSLGILAGMAVGLFSMWGVEMMVRLLFQGGSHSGMKLALGAAVKFPVLIAALLGIAFAADRKVLNVFGVVGGVLTIHATLLTMIIISSMAAQDSNRERYR